MNWSSSVAAIVEMAAQRTGWELPPARWLNAEVIIGQMMQTAGRPQIGDFLEQLRSDEQLLDDLIERLLIHETYFFREPQHFQLLRTEWAVEMQRLHGAHHTYRLWSAGCASGEEPYSLAIVCKQLGWADRVQIVATDLSRSALLRARQGIYTSWALRESDPAFLATYFHATADGRFELTPSIRSLVRFEYLNLNSEAYPDRKLGLEELDLILCRNVAIYLAPAILREVGRRLYRALAPGGWLLLGPSDPLLHEYAPFELRELHGVLIHRKPSTASPHGVSLPSSQSAKPVLREPATDAISPPASGLPVVEPALPGSWPGADAEEFRQTLLRRIKSLTDRNQLAEAEREVVAARARYPLASEFLFLHMLVLLGLDRHTEAAKLAAELIQLDRQLAIAHFFQGSSLLAIGNIEGARQAFENALRICSERPTHEPVAFADGQNHMRLGQAAAAQLKQLGQRSKPEPKVEK